MVYMSIKFKGKKFKVKKPLVENNLDYKTRKTLFLKKKKIDAISNLIGIENLHDLEALFLDDNQILEIDTVLNLENLKILSLKNNKIHEIKNLEGLPNLIKLNLEGNEITDILGLETLPNLEVLHLGNNKITEINHLDSLQSLKSLHLDRNQITEIKNLENLKQLTKLNLSDNQIKELKNINNLEQLRKLNLNNNQIIKILPIHLKNLEKVDISDNPFHKYFASRFANMTTEKLIAYSIDPEGLEKLFMVGMKNIFAPLDLSNLMFFIPQDEEVLYSTYSEIEALVFGGTVEWKSHVLVTESGIAFIDGPKKRNVFIKWIDFRKVRGYGQTVHLKFKSRMNVFNITIIRLIKFESKESYKKRLYSFPEICISLWKKAINKNEQEENKV